MTAEGIAKALGGRRAGAGWMARCPAHDDREPSLSIRQGEDGKVLVRCHAGCEQATVIAVLRSRGLWQGGHARRSDLRVTSRASTNVAIERSKARIDWPQIAPPLWYYAQSPLRRKTRDEAPAALFSVKAAVVATLDSVGGSFTAVMLTVVVTLVVALLAPPSLSVQVTVRVGAEP
jgi:hypothetical protein